MNSILGIDFGSRSIKLIEIASDRGNNPTLLAAGSIATPPKSLSSSLPADTQAIANALKILLKETGARSKQANIALPESQVFTRVIEMPTLPQNELSSALRWQAEQYIPLPLDQVNMDFSLLRDAKMTGTNKMEVLLVASPKTLIERYVTFLEYADLSALGVETEIIAASRSLARTAANIRTSMVISIGDRTTDIAILRTGVLAYTRSISAGGEALSRALAQGLGMDVRQAEEFKRTYGLDPAKLQGKIVDASKPIMDTITGETKRVIAFYQEKYPAERIEVVFLAGGTAKIPGMLLYFAQSLGSGVEIQLANPWVGVTRDPRFNVMDAEGTKFCIAAGLALR